MRGLDTQTHTQDNYSNPRCACALRVNNARSKVLELHTSADVCFTIVLDLGACDADECPRCHTYTHG